MLPLSQVESSAFQTFVKSLDSRYQLPSRKHLSTKLMTKKRKAIDNTLKQLLEKIPCVSLTLDLWTNRLTKGYLGTTCHFIDDDWSLQSVMLRWNRFYGQHTADNITQQYHETVDHYNLAEKISNIVTDSASNMLKAFRLPGFQLEENGSETDSDADDEEDNVDVIDLEGSMTYLPQHDPYFSHTLQLVVKDGFKNSRGINKVLAKAANIVSYVRKSTKASEILEGQRRLQAKVATRWNSELKSIKSLLSIPTDKLQQLEC